jgi:hypothetical protein
MPSLAFTVAMDFEGDQWTFFKHSLTDLYDLYGIDVQELTIWRPLVEHTAEQVSNGRVVLIEVDSFFLPDTAGVSYAIEHTKTTIAVQAINTTKKTLGYFHNAGYYTLSGDDFDGIFQLGAHAPAGVALAPYTEFAKLDNIVRSKPDKLMSSASWLTSAYVKRLPSTNPVIRYHERFMRDIEWLQEHDLQTFHQYAFATLRQCGARAELAATFIRWLGACEQVPVEAMARGFDAIANGAKTLQFKVARAVATKKPFDAEPIFDDMANGWELGTVLLNRRYGD